MTETRMKALVMVWGGLAGVCGFVAPRGASAEFASEGGDGSSASSSAVRGGEVVPAERALRLYYEVEVQDLPEGGRLRLWFPRPQTGAHQRVSGLRIVSDVPVELTREAVHGNAMVFLTCVGLADVRVRMEATVVRREVRALEGANAEQAVDEALDRWLEPDRLVPTDGVIAELAALSAPEDGAPLEVARALYDYVTETVEYDKTGTGWGRGDALYVCEARRGNCTDFHSLFIGLARSRGIPARFEIGFPVPADADSGEIAGYHCWAQFYVAGVGWVPIDSSEASRHPELREYLFGNLDPDRVLFTIGRDLVLEPPQQGDPLNFFVYPYAELEGEPLASEQIAWRVRFENVQGEGG